MNDCQNIKDWFYVGEHACILDLRDYKCGEAQSNCTTFSLTHRRISRNAPIMTRGSIKVGGIEVGKFTRYANSRYELVMKPNYGEAIVSWTMTPADEEPIEFKD